MEKLLQAWSIKTIQEAINISEYISRQGKTWEDVKQYVVVYNQRLGKKKETPVAPRPVKSCLYCKGNMFLFSVNDSKCRQVGGNYKSQWYCSNCGESILSERSVKEELENGNR